MGFCTLGVLFQRFKTCDFYFALERYRVLSIVLFCSSSVVVVGLEIPIEYFSLYGVLFSLLGGWFILSLSSIDFVANRLILDISRYVFSIYLIHFLTIGLVNDIWISYPIFIYVSPLITLFASYLIFRIGGWFMCKLKLLPIYSVLVGVRS